MSKTVHIESLRNDCFNFLLNICTFSTQNSGSIISLTNKFVDVNTDLFNFILNSINKAFSGEPLSATLKPRNSSRISHSNTYRGTKVSCSCFNKSFVSSTKRANYSAFLSSLVISSNIMSLNISKIASCIVWCVYLAFWGPFSSLSSRISE